MSRDIWLISDHHFGHANALTFLRNDGVTRMRPEFDTVEQMDEAMIERWNSVVKTGDKIYHLGDICFNSKTIDRVLPQLNGTKRLCLGNHDLEVPTLVKHIKKIMLWRLFKDEGFICSHIPLRPEQFRQKVVLNVHGHLHEKIIDDPRYFNVCVENHEYTPIHMDVVLQKVRLVRESIDWEEVNWEVEH